ncbi:hypothetical protein F4678DRAFT_420197 [Xylaria arbuscula]|nr:hypothetical protein F4678DRAFT_420197 [Xylaria arbuscula]
MSIAPQDIYTGLWTDWSKGSQVLGSTITITSSNSRLLAAFLALFVSLSVSYLWLFIVYSIHRARYRVTMGKCRGIVRQQQALLKAGLSPTSTSIRLIKLYWAYRSTPSAWHQSWLWISISVMSAIGGIIAGLFSSQIIDSSLYINVLADSSNCGWFFPPLGQSFDDPGTEALTQETATLVDMAATHARDCYNSTSDKSQCNFFSSTTIPWETEWEAECPFGDMCIGPAVRLDTGLINSNSLLGINSPTVEQIGLRKITTCAPIRQKGYTKIEPSTPNGGEASSPGDQLVLYLYGPTTGEDETWGIETYAANTGYEYTIANQYYFANSSADKSTWRPIHQLNNAHGDGTIIFLSSNAISFTEQCDDLVFSAHVKLDVANLTVYAEDNIAGILGCLEQYQLCSAELNSCSGIGGAIGVLDDFVEKVPLTAIQNSTANVIAFVLVEFGNMPQVTYGNTRHLVAGQSLVGGSFQLPLPSNQWQVEVQFWHATIMSMIQYGLLEYMTGPNNEGFQKYVKTPTLPGEQALCKRQRIRISQGFANVSGLGLFFTISLGTVVILLAFLLDNIMGCITWLSKGDGKKHRAWIQDDILHLQRLAYGQEELVGARWIATDDDIPLVEGNGFLDPIVRQHYAKTDDTYNRLSVD